MDMDTPAVPVGSQVAIYATADHNERKTITPPKRPEPADCSGQLQQDFPHKRARSTHAYLPHHLISRVCNHLPRVRDCVSFATVTSHTYGALEERLASARYTRQTENITDLDGLQSLLQSVEQHITVKPDLRGEPLGKLADRLYQIPETDRPEAFKKIFDAADAVPGHGDAVQMIAIGRLPTLPRQAHAEAFDFSFAALDSRPAQRRELSAIALATRIACLPETLRADRFDKLSSWIGTYRPLVQANLIAALATHLKDLQPAFVRDRYVQLLGWTERLPLVLQGKPRQALNAAIRYLPEHERPGRYEQGLQATMQLPDDQLGIALGGLMEGLAGLPAGQHADEFARLDPVARRLSPSQTKPVVEGLGHAFALLADHTRKDVFLSMLAMIARGPQKDKLALLKNTIPKIEDLPAHHWADGFNATMETLRSSGISAAERHDLYDCLHQIVFSAPETMRSRAMQQLWIILHN